MTETETETETETDRHMRETERNILNIVEKLLKLLLVLLKVEHGDVARGRVCSGVAVGRRRLRSRRHVVEAFLSIQSTTILRTFL